MNQESFTKKRLYLTVTFGLALPMVLMLASIFTLAGGPHDFWVWRIMGGCFLWFSGTLAWQITGTFRAQQLTLADFSTYNGEQAEAARSAKKWGRFAVYSVVTPMLYIGIGTVAAMVAFFLFAPRSWF